jgi:hypothetical protein
MKGKEALAAAHRRLAGACEHIDQLSEQLAEAKRRVRDAEARADKADRLEKLLADKNNDELLAEALDTIRWWEKVRVEDVDRRRAAWRELGARLLPDLQFRGNTVDRMEFLLRRYPALCAALSAGEWADIPVRDTRYQLGRSARHLSEEERSRLQRQRGIREASEGDDDTDVAEVWADVLEAKQTGFAPHEIEELIGFRGKQS